MKNALIIFAHPEPKSMNGLLKNKAVEILQAMDYQVRVSDLYAIDFPAAIKKRDYPFYDSDFFDLQIAQVNAQRLNQQPKLIKEEQEKLLWADLVIFQFPLWWYSVPAIMKSYIDHVFSAGFAYAGNFALEGKQYLLSFTTGAPEFLWIKEKKGTIDQVLFHLDVGTFKMLKTEKLNPFIGFGTKRMSDSERNQLCIDYETHLQQQLQ